jgi:hypothetical protein
LSLSLTPACLAWARAKPQFEFVEELFFEFFFFFRLSKKIYNLKIKLFVCVYARICYNYNFEYSTICLYANKNLAIAFIKSLMYFDLQNYMQTKQLLSIKSLATTSR